MKKAQPNQAMTGVIALGGIASALDATKTKAPSVGETHRASAVPTLVEASPMIVIDTELSLIHIYNNHGRRLNQGGDRTGAMRLTDGWSFCFCSV